MNLFTNGNIPRESTIILQEEVSIPVSLYVLLQWVSYIIIFEYVYRGQHFMWLYLNPTRGSIDTSLIVRSPEVSVLSIILGFVYRGQRSAWLYLNTTRRSIDTSLIVRSSEVSELYNNTLVVYTGQHSAWLYLNTTRRSIDTSLIIHSS